MTTLSALPQRTRDETGMTLEAETMDLADGRTVPDECVAALDRLNAEWPGAVLPAARGAAVAAALGGQPLDPTRVRKALEAVIERQDYDLHKAILSDEETGEDAYPAVVEQFMAAYACAGRCSSCEGRGSGGPASGAETNGRCADCRATGHGGPCDVMS
jgi:hypothetical protein